MDRFWSKTQYSPGCWEWTANALKSGYGRFKLDGKQMYAHRVAYELMVGLIPPGVKVRHKCDNPPCVNPDHLELGTHADNMRDRDERGRNPFSNRTHCPKGHEYSEENTRRYKDSRFCRKCDAARHRKGGQPPKPE